jgi:flagellar hook-length control protein FliK
MISANENQAHLNLWTQEADVLTEAKSELVDMGELALGDLAEGEEETADLTQTVSERSSQTVSATAAQGQADLVSMFAEQDALQANVMPEVSVNPLPVVDVSSNTAQVADSAPVSQTVTPQNIAEQIVQNVRYVSGEQMAEIRIQLKPEHLGELSLRIATINGIVTAQFLAENQRVKELIEAGFNHLKDALEQAGINISDIEVNVSTGDGQWDDETEGHVSDKRIRGLMGADVGEVDEVPLAREENLVDYRV